MEFGAVLLSVKDIKKSRMFYERIFGCKVRYDFNRNIEFDIPLSLQELELWKEFIDGREVIRQNNAVEVYFEEQDFDGFIKRLEQEDIDYVHPVKCADWGQRCVRIYDPDKHIIEIGESLENVCLRFLKDGMTIEEVCDKTMLPREFVEKLV